MMSSSSSSSSSFLMCLLRRRKQLFPNNHQHLNALLSNVVASVRKDYHPLISKYPNDNVSIGNSIADVPAPAFYYYSQLQQSRIRREQPQRHWHSKKRSFSSSSSSTAAATTTSTTTTTKLQVTEQAKQYLCRDTFPLGSIIILSQQQPQTTIPQAQIQQQQQQQQQPKCVWNDVVDIIEKLTADRATPAGIQLAFALVDRLADEMGHFMVVSQQPSQPIQQQQQQQQQHQQRIPQNLIPNVILAWKLYWRDNSTRTTTTNNNDNNNLTPAVVFDKVQLWQSRLVVDQSRQPQSQQQQQQSPLLRVVPDPYAMIMQVVEVTSLQDPELAENMLDRLIQPCLHKQQQQQQEQQQQQLQEHHPQQQQQQQTDNASMFPNTALFNIVIHAWAKSGRDDAPVRAERILQSMHAFRRAGWSQAAPDAISYSTVITSWANHYSNNISNNNITNNSNVSNKYITNNNNNNNTNAISSSDNNGVQDEKIAASSTMSTTSLSSSSSSSPSSCLRAEQLLREMYQHGLVPNQSAYYSVLRAWTNNNKDMAAASRARNVLNHMTRMHEQNGIHDAKPDTNCYAAVISAFANRRDVYEAEQVLKELIHKFTSTQDRTYLPDRTCFTTVMDAWAKSNWSKGPEMAEMWLFKLHDLAEFTRVPSLRPNVTVCNAVLKAWSQCAKAVAKMAPRRCEDILQRMREWNKHYQRSSSRSNRNNTDASCAPNVVSYQLVLDCWAKASSSSSSDDNNDDDAAPRAEALLRHLEDLYHQSGMAHAKPTLITYNTVLAAWSRSNVPHAGERAQILYDELKAKAMGAAAEEEEVDDDNYYNMKPDAYTYLAMISCWGRRRTIDGATKAQAIFDEMVEAWNHSQSSAGGGGGGTNTNTTKDWKPAVMHYSALIDAWGKAGDAEKAEEVLRSMEPDSSGSSSSRPSVMPNLICYNAVLNAWGLAGRPDRAQALFDEIRQQFDAGNRALRPNLRTYTALIAAWGRAKSPHGASQAQAVFDDLWHRYHEQGVLDLKPDNALFNSLIDAWAKAGDPERASELLQEMKSEDRYGRILSPDLISFNTVMKAWSDSSSKDAAERVQALYDEVKIRYRHGEKKFRPDKVTYSIVIDAWCRRRRRRQSQQEQEPQHHPDGQTMAKAAFEDMRAAYKSGQNDLKSSIDTCYAKINKWI